MDGVNEEIWKNWEKGGKNEFTKLCVQLVKDDTRSPLFDKNGKLTEITSYINILIEKGLQGTIRKESVVGVLQELVVLHSDIPSIILDVLNIADASSAQIDNASEESKERNIFCFIIKECEKFVSDKLLKERLEIDTLQEVGILKNRAFYSKFIKVKTKLYYKQKKFNLFREECEGFSKLITELNQEFNENTNNERILGIVQSLIGCFNLDPNRVLDIILESFENKPDDAHLFIPLVKSYMSDPKIISEVLGSKYSFLRNTENGAPKSLHILTAQLLQNSIISLDDIYPWLTPDDKIMQKECEKNMKEAKEYFRKLQVISVNKTDKEETPEEPENPIEKYKWNQKLGLCEALLLIGDWENAKILINHLPEHYAVGFEPIALALCNLLHYVIEPVYRENFKLGTKFKGKPIPPHKNPKAPKAAQTFEDLRQNAFPMLLTLAPSLRYDTVLMCKVIRLAKLILGSYGVENAKSEVPEDKMLYFDILTLLDITILPSLSYLDCNCCIAEEIWTLLKLYPYQIRYCLYNRWKNDTYMIYPDLLRKRGDSEKQIKNIMKRVSKENVKPVGRSIGKLTHCSPGFLFDYVLLQIQVYNNLIHPVVDSLKYLTSLSYDVLGYCLIECLANADKKRVKHDSTSISTWLQSLSSFCGAIYKKYNIELSGLLQYVANQLKAQKSLDLLILKEVVQKMAGIESAEDLTIDQLSAMAGGELLRAEAGYFGQVRNTKKSSLRLKEAMADQNLAVSLCLLMAQQKYCVVYKETQQSHLKLVGKLSDQCQDTLVQFGNFLGSTMSVDEYVNKLPSIQSMLLNYHIPNEVAFFLARPMFNHEINIKYDQLRKADTNYKKLSTSVKHQKYFEAVTEVMQPVHKSLIPLHPMKIWEDISPQFLATFWSLTMYDLCIPEDTYTEVINKLKQQSLSVLDSNSNKGKKEQERHATLIEKLQDEKKKQSEHVDKVMYRLKQEKDHWFVSKTAKTAKNETITRFLQLCLFPRCTFTAIDALYCAKFVHVIHMLKTPNFSTLLCYDRLFCDITYSVTSCTENEAMRYGRFLYAMLETVMRWHRSKDVFEKECANYPGFVTKFRVSNQHADNMDNVGYENYRHVCHKWHYKLAKAMVTCLESKDYIQIRNALIILIKIINYFPVLIKLSQFVEKRIEKVRDEEKNNRQDLFTLSSSYLALLKQRIASGNMVKEGDFHIIIEKVSKTQHDQKTSNSSTKHNGDSKDEKEKVEKKSSKQVDEVKTVVKTQSPEQNGSKEKVEKTYKEETREKHRKEDKPRDDADKEREREKRRERKEEKLLKQEEWQYREERERYQDAGPKDETRYSNERSVERYYDDRGAPHYYRDVRDDRDLAVGSNGSASMGRHSQETDPDREAKRRKLDGSSKLQERQQIEVEAAAILKPRPTASNVKLPIVCLQSSKHEDRSKVQHQQQFDYVGEKVEKKERTVKVKEKRDKLTEEERELRKERKLGRKRDRGDEAQQQAEIKRRRDEERAKILPHPNGELMEPSQHSREKHHRSTRELSPYSRERSHDRVEVRDKHRRSAENKRR
ncbi:THO complex subunit 2 isoform X1 [Coccinella septempunctata]|uniref:THO complex subunit 2 isoform X1 n=1 Tax=Coccinella septempunctata TaxID=41139 RepID=UPI001D076C72|nr:THO complex subunit 2 isoform X1 [Coccinella septempunctata]